MAEPKKFCIHSDGLGYCDILSDSETRQDCVEDPCPHEELVEYVPVVRCKDCKHYQNGRVFTDIKFCFRLKDRKGKAIGHTRSDNDFCSYGEPKGERKE